MFDSDAKKKKLYAVQEKETRKESTKELLPSVRRSFRSFRSTIRPSIWRSIRPTITYNYNAVSMLELRWLGVEMQWNGADQRWSSLIRADHPRQVITDSYNNYL